MDCKSNCPWPRFKIDDFHDQNCNKCTWSKIIEREVVTQGSKFGKEKLSCNSFEDNECEFGINFRGLDTYQVGSICYSHDRRECYTGQIQCNIPNLNTTGGGTPSHQSSTGLLRQLQTRIGDLNSGQKCRNQGGFLKVRLFPPPRRIICDLCQTKSGPSPNQPCIFPFTWNGKTYNGCPIDPEDSSERWCSTKVDSNGNHITGQGNWGHCNSKCRKQN